MSRTPSPVRDALGVAVAWLLLSDACYAVMRVTTRMTAEVAPLPWAQIAAFRFLVGALVPLGAALLRGAFHVLSLLLPYLDPAQQAHLRGLVGAYASAKD